jgi:anti-sigma B factor antagonist
LLVALYLVEKLVDGVMVVDLRGRLVLGEETEILRNRIKRLIEAGHTRIVLNLEGVSYIDSSGLSTLITTFVSVRKKGGDLKLLRLTGRVSDIMQITKLSTVFEIYDTIEEAQRSFAQSAGA